MKPIYKPSGAAKECGGFALNIYTGCPHNCYYCYGPNKFKGTNTEVKAVLKQVIYSNM